MDTQQHSSIINFYTMLQSHLILCEYGHGIVDIPTPHKMRKYLNTLDSNIFTVIADRRTTTITWSIRD